MKKKYMKFVKDHPQAGKVIGDVVEETPETRQLMGRGIATRIKMTEKEYLHKPVKKKAASGSSKNPTTDV